MKRIIESGVYRHFKGNYYEVLCIAKHTETGEQVVVYKALYGDGKIYARPLEMFASEVDKEKYPNARQRYRFDRIYNTPKEKDMSSVCEGLYTTYWMATHVDRTMTKEEFDKWFSENYGQCCYMDETCIKD